jgi:hypothetical protein
MRTFLFSLFLASLPALAGAPLSPTVQLEPMMAGTYSIRVHNPTSVPILAHVGKCTLANGELEAPIKDVTVAPGATVSVGVVIATDPSKPVSAEYSDLSLAPVASEPARLPAQANAIPPPAAPAPDDNPPILPAATDAQIKEWATRPFVRAQPSNGPSPLYDGIDLGSIKGLRVERLFSATPQGPYDIEAMEVSGEGSGSRRTQVVLLNRSGHGLSVDYRLMSDPGIKTTPPPEIPVHKELGSGEQTVILTATSTIPAGNLHFGIQAKRSGQPTLRHLVEQYEAWGWRIGGPVPELQKRLAAAVPVVLPSGTPVVLSSNSEAMLYGRGHPGVRVTGPTGKPYTNTRTVNTSPPSEYEAAKFSLFRDSFARSHPQVLGYLDGQEASELNQQFDREWLALVRESAPWLYGPRKAITPGPNSPWSRH